MFHVHSLLVSSPLPTATSFPLTISATASSDPLKTRRALGSALRSLSKQGRLDEALRLIESSPSANAEACSAFLHSCISSRSLDHGHRLLSHLLLMRHDLAYDPTLRAKLVTLCSVCGRVDEARRVFEDSLGNGCGKESLWVAMAVGLSRNGRPDEALVLYCDMVSLFGVPGQFWLSVALKACTSLLDLRVACMPSAGALTMPTASIREIARRNLVTESFDAFRRMQREGIGFSWVTLTTILALCATATALLSSKEVHAQIMKSWKSTPDVLVLNSLIDMYAKCGAVNYCRDVFDGMQEKDLTSWNTMLNGYSINGRMADAFELFDAMVIQSGFKPDGVTFIALLSGCSDTGLVNEGIRLFDEMKAAYGISPTWEHYACLVDLLGRAGRIEEALDVANKMPMAPTGSIWGSLLNSCRLHSRVSIVQEIASRLFELEPDNPGNYVMLSNIYADAGMWVHVFVASWSVEFRNSPEYSDVRNYLTEAMKEAGYLPDTKIVLHDVNEDTWASWVFEHSERIATMFALIHTAHSMPIRITKNLRSLFGLSLLDEVCFPSYGEINRITRHKSLPPFPGGCMLL
ncbi:hypothetical protein CRG98_019375 [Punica granatum]|uniref:DYW domain-containing protein n=1 Tax=Punica granatum TaxID=22663 RepID=A0A2I0JV38_PUNGR|nr:hypothetical protein CRG98_019375 [Punica granatum]